MANRAVRKVLSYRDSSGASQDAHIAHWAGFRWTTGPVIVASVGDHGTVKVFASTAEEGKRVIRHAAAIAAFDPDDPEAAVWIITSTSNLRFGRSAEVGIKVRAGVPYVTKRVGSSGAPLR